MAKLKTSRLTTFERIKLKEIAELDKLGINPLTVSVGKSGTFYRYTKDDVLNYYASIGKRFSVNIFV